MFFFTIYSSNSHRPVQIDLTRYLRKDMKISLGLTQLIKFYLNQEASLKYESTLIVCILLKSKKQNIELMHL